MALSHADRPRRYRLHRSAGAAKTAYRTPKDRRSRRPRLHDTIARILTIREEYRDGRQALPETREETTATAELLDPVIEALHDLDFDLLAELELVRGFGRGGCVRLRTRSVTVRHGPAMGSGIAPRRRMLHVQDRSADGRMQLRIPVRREPD